MKKIFALIMTIGLGFSGAGYAAGNADFSGWLSSMMTRVAAAAQEKLVQKEAPVPVAAAGLRGSEQKKETLEPYWKGDLTQRSPDYQAYHQIEAKMQAGQYADALKLIQGFNQKYAKSKLVPEVRFTTGLAYAGLGQNKPALAAFEEVVKHYPDHELAEPSREGIARLKKA